MSIGEHERLALRQAWQNHCTALNAVVSDAIDGKLGDARDGNELAELVRSIGRISAMSLQHRMDFNDPNFPLFLRQMDDRFRYGGPDNNIAYFQASLNGGATYRIRGNNGGRTMNIGMLWDENITADDDGTFEVTVSAKEQPGNWTPIPADLRGDTHIPEIYPAAGSFNIRRYDWDWDSDLAPGWLSIERVDEQAPAYPAALEAGQFAAQIENATRLFRAAARWWNQRAADVRAHNPVNEITPPSTLPPGVKNYKPPVNAGRPWLFYGIVCLDLGDDEAIVIETDLPDGAYWSFTLYNMWWESPDIMNRQTSLNQNQTHIDADGKARFVISAKDPGVPNWLDSGGPRRGFLHYRWFRPDVKVPVPTSRLVKFDDIAAAMPSDHPRIDLAGRKAILSKRREQLAKRFQR
ncbi:hypothetical protein GCM10011614_27810 [Novosphingobium colocasiae]|uniref:DUF1214 domain-containing protein n=2 Tax=Novosphingobium colocasiae TaxID=1256513 RepID=A0A918PK90_9SPHN|nr:hypothetical protein GCM10011614_27810 [Novosphingobium colocasiae]